MLHKIQYFKYNFNNRQQINERDYSELKNLFTEKPYFNLPNPKSYYEEHKGEVNISIISFSICLTLIPFGESIDGTIFMLILALSFIIFLFSTIFQISQFFSFQKAREKQIKHLNKLKRDIINSHNFEHFSKLQKNQI